MAIVYLGLGSNIGNRRKKIENAVMSLNEAGVTVEKLSTIIETEPEGGPPQEKFMNAVAKAKTHLSPEKLLNVVQEIEQKLGRQRTVKNGPRTIDIDILLYEGVTIKTKTLIIPHPRMTTRDFVLKPLKEIEPSIVQDILS